MSVSDEKQSPSTRRLVIAFVDIVSSSALMEQLGDERALNIFRELSDISAQLAEIHSGKILKSLGDGLLGTFDRTWDAVLFAKALRRYFRDRHLTAGAHLLSFRMSIHTGVVSLVGRPYGPDIFGHSVALAARLNNIAAPDEIAISAEAVKELSKEQVELLSATETQALKGMGDVEFRRFKLDQQAEALDVR